MKVGIAGAGFMGTAHAAGWAATDATIAGFLTDRSGSAQKLASQYGARVYPGYDALLADVDVVDICTPTHTHAELALMAAKAGKHIVCEKPLARTVAEAQQVVAACAQAGVTLLVAHVLRFSPEYALAKARVDANEIGRPAALRLARGSYQPQKPAGNWFLDEEKSGGIMLDFMIHDLDYARWIAGEVESVFAKSIGTTAPGAPVDHAMALLKHRSGAMTHVAASWAYPPPTFRTSLEIAGDAGLIAFTSPSTEPIEALLRVESATVSDVALPDSALSESPYTAQIKSFYETLAHAAPPRVTPQDGLAAVQIALAAIESARTGKAVFLKPLPEVAS
ncbi:MAG TPA: Gfo/Idh/MocA family oxidoreductase [Roseiflexaceae bacterium]|nr:Gfo/Idh/MocA family oxidoreductase [Roseiflexaceae bacterium]